MEKNSFSFEMAEQLNANAPMEKQGKHLIRLVSEECKNYMNKYFFITDGDYYFWNALIQDFVPQTRDSIKDKYMNRLPEEISNWFFKQNRTLHTIVNEVNKPRIFDKKLNMFHGFKYNNPKKYAQYSKAVQGKVDIYLNYIKEVICSNNEACQRYIIKWIANVCQGKKNDSCLYMKGPEGIGKSSLSGFLMKHVLGNRITTKAKPDVLRTSYNKILCGKVLAVFEELPTFSDKEWEGISSVLKDMVTDTELLYSEKYEKQFQAANINNYIINTNVDALKSSEGRRYFIAELSTKRRGDHEYFGKLNDICFNDEVGEAFFAYMLEVDTAKFNAQRDMPETQNKLNAIAERLPPEIKFLKEEYILNLVNGKRNIKCTARELYNEYANYCLDNGVKPLQFTKFTTKLQEINIEYKKSHGVYKFNVTYEELNSIALKYKWIHELDEYKQPGHGDNKSAGMNVNHIDYGTVDERDKVIQELTSQIELLKKELADAKAKVIEKDPTQQVIPPEKKQQVILAEKKTKPKRKLKETNGQLLLDTSLFD